MIRYFLDTNVLLRFLRGDDAQLPVRTNAVFGRLRWKMQLILTEVAVTNRHGFLTLSTTPDVNTLRKA